MSIKLRLTMLYTGMLGLTLVIFAVVVYFTTYTALRVEVDREISAMASSVVKSIKVSKQTFDLKQVILPNVDVFSSPGTYLQIVDNRGNLIARSGNLGLQSLPLSEDTLLMAEGGKGFYENVHYGKQDIRIYNQPLVLDNQVISVLQVGRSLSQAEMVLRRLKLVIVIGGLITILSTGLLGWSLAKAVLKPIEKITEAASSIQRGSDLGKRIDYRGSKDELYTLVETLNRMLERVENLYRQLEEINESQKRFVADASHELRTPLTTIRGNAELLIKMGDCNPAVRSEALADIAGEAERLTGMVSNLLYLARADAGQGVETSQMALIDLMERVIQGMKYHKRKDIGIRGLEQLPRELSVDVNADLMVQAVNNLLDNAIKYTSNNGELHLGVALEGNQLVLNQSHQGENSKTITISPGHVAIYVEDSGPGILDEDRMEIFERFYRGKAVRGISGSGLGLSIAQWILQKHNGQIELISIPGKGSLFALILPVMQ